MKQHIDILGYLFLANGALVLIAGLFIGLVLGNSAALSGAPEAAGILASIVGMLWIILLAIPYVATVFGLLKRTS